MIKSAAGAFRSFAGEFERLPHQVQSKGNERILTLRQLDGSDVERSDLPEGPAFKEPFGAKRGSPFQFLSGVALSLPVGAELNVVQQNPAAAFDVRCETKHVEQRPRMAMVGVDKGEAKLAGRGDLAGEIRFAAGMDSHGGNEVGNQIGNLESDGTRFIDAAMGVGVDGVD